jgi:prophage antirepressor-like protein
MNFFLDVFNKLFKIKDNMIFFDKEGNVWFKFRDILLALGYNNIDYAIKNIKIDNQNKVSFEKFKALQKPTMSHNFQKNTILINESGLYQILAVSTKPLAKVFRDKYIKEIIPKIIKTGEYTVDSNEKKQLDKINKKLDNYKQDKFIDMNTIKKSSKRTSKRTSNKILKKSKKNSKK